MNAAEQVLSYPFGTAKPAAAEVREVAPGILWLRMPLPFALDHINLWLLEDGEGYAAVDCGYAAGPTRALWEQIFTNGMRGRPLTRVIVTHCHPDHAGNAAWLTERFGVDMYMSQADYLTAHSWRNATAGFNVDGLIPFFRSHGLDERRLGELHAERGSSYKRGVPEFPNHYRRIMDGDVLVIGGDNAGGHAWRVMMGYGHAPEHAALHCAERGIFISGDMILPKISTNISVTNVDGEANPLRLFLDSIENYAHLPADTLVLPSHGLPFRGLHERVDQLHEHHRLRLAELLDACRTSKSAAEVITTLFRRELDTHQMFFAMGEAIAHLNFLRAEGAIARDTGGDGVMRFVAAS